MIVFARQAKHNLTRESLQTVLNLRVFSAVTPPEIFNASKQLISDDSRRFVCVTECPNLIGIVYQKSVLIVHFSAPSAAKFYYGRISVAAIGGLGVSVVLEDHQWAPL